MSLDEFLIEFQTAANQYEWQVRGNSFLRTQLTKEHTYLCGNYHCPITAVYFARTGKYLHPTGAWAAGIQLGLSIADVARIIVATDERYAADSNLRQSLLEACGLKEDQL